MVYRYVQFEEIVNGVLERHTHYNVFEIGLKNLESWYTVTKKSKPYYD